jgi:hypothetical protein
MSYNTREFFRSSTRFANSMVVLKLNSDAQVKCRCVPAASSRVALYRQTDISPISQGKKPAPTWLFHWALWCLQSVTQ